MWVLYGWLHVVCTVHCVIMPHYETKQIECSLNRVRCYLEVLTVADIATGDGSSICLHFLLGKKSNQPSKYTWPVEHPDIADFQ